MIKQHGIWTQSKLIFTLEWGVEADRTRKNVQGKMYEKEKTVKNNGEELKKPRSKQHSKIK